jgi:hypothetical protein
MSRRRFAHMLLLAVLLTVRNVVERGLLLDGRLRAARAARLVRS